MKNPELKDYEYLREMSLVAQIGWWEADFLTKQYKMSDSVVQLLGLEEDTIGFYEFGDMIREDYRNNIAQEFGAIPRLKKYYQVFPVINGQGEEVWIHSRMVNKRIEEGRGLVVNGFIQRVDSPERIDTDYLQINNQVTLRSSLSDTLSKAVRENSVAAGIPAILNAVMRMFRGGYAYVIEYDELFEKQSCTYEVVADGVQPARELLQTVSLHTIRWWSSQILSGKAILMDTLDDFPKEAAVERAALEAHAVRSLMAVPLLIDNQIRGYMGVNLVGEQRTWNNDDYQWLSMLGNVVSICLELVRMKQEAEVGRASLNNLFKYMPVGYIRFARLYNKQGEMVDYRVVDLNKRYAELVGRSMESMQDKMATEIAPGLFELVKGRLEGLDETKYKEMDLYFARTRRHGRAIIYVPTEDEVAAFFLDTTEITQAYKSLDTNEKLLRNIFSSIPVGVEFYDKDGRLTNLNEKNMEMFGVECEQALGVNLFENPNIPDTVKEQMHRETELDFRLSYRFDVAKNYCVMDGKGTLELIVKFRKVFDEEGNLEGYILINIDHTELMGAMSKIEEFENLFLMISDHAKVGYIKMNFCTREGYAIRRWYENMSEDESTPLADIVGVYSNMHPDDRQTLLEFFEDVKRGYREKSPGGGAHPSSGNYRPMELDTHVLRSQQIPSGRGHHRHYRCKL